MQTAREIMTKTVVTVPSSITVALAMTMMRERRLRNLIVEPDNSDDSYGIVTEADIVYKVAAYTKNPENLLVADIMTKPCVEIDPDMSVQEVAALFANHGIHRAPVIKDRLLGIITVFDIVRETLWWQ